MKSNLIKCSVITPILNGEKYIDVFFNSLKSQSLYPNFELIIALGECSDHTLEAINKNNHSFDATLILVKNKSSEIAVGLNKCIDIASSDVLVRVDVHTLISRYYLEEVLTKVQKDSKLFLSGELITTPGGSGYVAQSISMAQSSSIGSGPGSSFRYGPGEDLSTVETAPFCAMNKKTLVECGGYDERFIGSEDDELNFRARNNGVTIKVTKKVKAHYSSRDSFTGIYSQYFGYGKHKTNYIKKYGKVYSTKIFIPALLALCLLIIVFSSIFEPHSLLLIFPILFAYLIFGFLVATNFFMSILVAFSIFIMHFSYGLGFIYGVLILPFNMILFDNKDLK